MTHIRYGFSKSFYGLVFHILCRLVAAQSLLYTGFNTTIPSFQFNGTIPASAQLPQNCSSVYSAFLDCDSRVLIAPTTHGKAKTLQTVCNPSCASALYSYESNVREACGSLDLPQLGLNGSWLQSIIDGTAVLDVYWKECLRDLFVLLMPLFEGGNLTVRRNSSKLCHVSEADYQLAWSAVTSESDNGPEVEQFCVNSCLTQTIVLNVPTASNLGQLQNICGDLNIEKFPFAKAMVFAKQLEITNGSDVLAAGESEGRNGNGTTTSQSRSSGRRFGDDDFLLLLVLALFVNSFMTWV